MDLDLLAGFDFGQVAKVWQEEQNYLLSSNVFEKSDDARTVFEKAKRIVQILNGELRLDLGGTGTVGVGNWVQLGEGGRKHYFLIAKPAKIVIRTTPVNVTVTRADGTVEERRSREEQAIARNVEMALSDDSVANALRIVAAGDLDWVNLYRLFEIVRGDLGGEHIIISNGWASRSALKRFRGTANSPSLLGLEARHGASAVDPPRNPMDIYEARQLLDTVVRAWLELKRRQ